MALNQKLALKHSNVTYGLLCMPYLLFSILSFSILNWKREETTTNMTTCEARASVTKAMVGNQKLASD